MLNNISACGLGEFANEVRQSPEEAVAAYGVRLDWETAMRSQVSSMPMRIGPHRVSRNFSWKIDEPRQLLGGNHGPNPQEMLLSGLGACLMAAFVAGATARGVQLDSLAIEIEGELDLHGFLGIGSEAEATVGFPELRYRIHVTADASEEELEAIRWMAVAHSPNAMTITRAVALKGELIARQTNPGAHEVAA